jgi:tetratricopeptide (TPR) repeat protein
MLSEAQEQDLKATLSMRFEQVLLTFSTIDARSAEAGDKDAKMMLVKLLEDRPGGFGAVNICITKMLREWLLRIARRFDEHGSSDDAGLLAGLGELEHTLGSDLKKALMYHERSLELRRQRLGTNAADTAASEHRIGFVLNGMGRAREALPYFARALETRQLLGDDEALADSHAGIGCAYQCLKDGPLALTMFAQALKAYKSLPGTEDRIADTLNNIGTMYADMEKHPEALQVACTCLTRITSSFRLGRKCCHV